MKNTLFLLLITLGLSGCSLSVFPSQHIEISHQAIPFWYDKVFLCSDSEADRNLYKKLLEQGVSCSSGEELVVACDLQCHHITGYQHLYTVPSMHLQFTQKYDKLGSAFDFLHTIPKYQYFFRKGSRVEAYNDYNPYGGSIFIEYHANESRESRKDVLKMFQDKGYVVEPYTDVAFTGLLLYEVSDRLIVTDRMPTELVYMFSPQRTDYYVASREVVEKSCNPGPCSIFSDVLFFNK